jgi:phenylacetate-CoA ligase
MISRNLFILAHQVGDRKFYPTYKKLIQNQWNSYEELKEEQEKQLKVMINFAYKNVPYYHKLFDDLKLSPDEIKGVVS